MRPRALAVTTLGVLMELTYASSSHAAVPSPVNSTVPPCFVGCPFGDIAFTVTVRDAANNFQPNSTVVLDFSSCSEVSFCPTQEPGTTVVGKSATRVSDGFGVDVFHLHVGGLCPSGTVRVSADGVILALRPVVSTDQDGNLVVNATDETIASSKVGGSDHSADFDCDGDVDSVDLGVLANHLGHACDFATPVQPRSWGYLKILYR